MSLSLAVSFVVDIVKDTYNLHKEFIRCGIDIENKGKFIGNCLRVTGIRIIEFPSLEVHIKKLGSLSDIDFNALGLDFLSVAKDCYIYSYMSNSNNTLVNFVIRDSCGKLIPITVADSFSIAFVESENGDLLFTCGLTFSLNNIVYMRNYTMDSDGNFCKLDLANSYYAMTITINMPSSSSLGNSLSFCYALGKGSYLFLGDCVIWTNIIGDSIIYKGSIFSYSDYRDIFNTHHLFCNIDLFKEIGYLFTITRNLICIDGVSILFRYETNKEFVIPSDCKYFICDTYDGLSNYNSVIFPPDISFIKFKYNELGKYGDKKKYSNCTFYFNKNTNVSLFTDVLFNQFLASYIYKQYNKEDSVVYSKDFRNIVIFGRYFRTTMTKEKFEISRSKLLKDINTAEDFVKHFKKLLPIKIKLY